MPFSQKDVSSELALILLEIRHRFVLQMWRGMQILVLVSLPVSLLRAWFTGWLPIYNVHIALSVLIVVIVQLGTRIPFSWRGALLILIPWAVALIGVLNFGLSAAGILWFCLSFLVAGIVYSGRFAFQHIMAVMVALTVLGAGFVTGYLSPSVDLNVYVRNPLSWLNLVIATGAFSGIVLYAVGSYGRAMYGLIQELELHRTEIARLAAHDPLTGLMLMHGARGRIEHTFQSALRNDQKAAVIFIDMDNFKDVNDTHGHFVGDRVLQEVADRLNKATRVTDTSVRLGGDEFLLVIEALASESSAIEVARKLIASIAAPMFIEDKVFRVQASVGIAIFPDHGRELETLRRMADAAMYKAKRGGGNKFDWA